MVAGTAPGEESVGQEIPGALPWDGSVAISPVSQYLKASGPSLSLGGFGAGLTDPRNISVVPEQKRTANCGSLKFLSTLCQWVAPLLPSQRRNVLGLPLVLCRVLGWEGLISVNYIAAMILKEEVYKTQALWRPSRKASDSFQGMWWVPTQCNEIVHEGKTGYRSGPSSHMCQYFLGFNECQTLILILSFSDYLLSARDGGKRSEISGRGGRREMKCLVKSKEDLTLEW